MAPSGAIFSMKLKNFKEFIFESVDDIVPDWARELVPPIGPANTLEGEFLRALFMIRYRWYNDGDKFYTGYGIETAGKSAELLREIPEARKLIDSMGSGKKYENFIQKLTTIVIDYVGERKGKYTDNFIDMWHFKPEDMDVYKNRGKILGKQSGIT